MQRRSSHRARRVPDRAAAGFASRTGGSGPCSSGVRIAHGRFRIVQQRRSNRAPRVSYRAAAAFESRTAGFISSSSGVRIAHRGFHIEQRHPSVRALRVRDRALTPSSFPPEFGRPTPRTDVLCRNIFGDNVLRFSCENLAFRDSRRFSGEDRRGPLLVRQARRRSHRDPRQRQHRAQEGRGALGRRPGGGAVLRRSGMDGPRRAARPAARRRSIRRRRTGSRMRSRPRSWPPSSMRARRSTRRPTTPSRSRTRAPNGCSGRRCSS